jgi:hypothetical protein
MGISGGPDMIQDGLVLALDAADRNSYPGSGTTWRDMSGNNNTSTLTNGPTFNSANGGSIVFDGTNDFSTSPDSTSLRPTSFSIDTWFRPTSFSAFNTVVVKPFNGPPWTDPYLSYMIRIETNGTLLNCSTSTGGVYRFLNTSYTFLANTIYNVSFTFNSATGNAIAYLNGSVLSSTTHTAGAISYSSAPVLVGASYGTNPVGEFFAGNIYNVKVYNTILTAANITQNYNSLKSRFNL